MMMKPMFLALALLAGNLYGADMLAGLTPEELKPQWSPVSFAMLDGHKIIRSTAKISGASDGMQYLRFVLQPKSPWDLRGKQVNLKVRSLAEGDLFIIRFFNQGETKPVRGYQATGLLKETEQSIRLGEKSSNLMKVEGHPSPEKASRIGRIEIWLGTRTSPAEPDLIISEITVTPEEK